MISVWLEENGEFDRLPLKWKIVAYGMIGWCGLLSAATALIYIPIMLKDDLASARGFEIDVDDASGDQVIYNCEVCIG